MRFDKHSDLIVREETPFNAEPPPKHLIQEFVTPAQLFFVRNHGNVPEISSDSYRLAVTGLVNETLSLSLDDLRTRFSKATVMTTLQCAGSRRDELAAIAPLPGEVLWSAQAVGNAVWSGAPLKELLAAAGVKDEARHVEFSAGDEIEKEGRRFGFGGSIPLDKAQAPEVLLAYEMNGNPLPPEHGFPLRVVVPGYLGARSVKWLTGINVQDAPSENYYQARSYKLFPPQVRPETVDWEKGLMLGELSVNAVICTPGHGDSLAAGRQPIRGYAIAGGNRRVERVDVSMDGGQTWATADILNEDRAPWAWVFWEARIELPNGESRIVVRAFDSAANTQPEDPRTLWNFKGYMNNAWHGITVRVGNAP